MQPYTWPAGVTLLAIALLVWTAANVGSARMRHGVRAPATSGPPEFERAFRVQMNTIENFVAFVPALWLAAFYGYAVLAGAAGLVWVAGRVYYALAYVRDPGSRSAGFGISYAAFVVILLAALVGFVRALAGI